MPSCVTCRSMPRPNRGKGHVRRFCLKCNKRAAYGLANALPTHCSQHRMKNQINVLHKNCRACNKRIISACSRCNRYLCRQCYTALGKLPEAELIVAIDNNKASKLQKNSFIAPKEPLVLPADLPVVAPSIAPITSISPNGRLIRPVVRDEIMRLIAIQNLVRFTSFDFSGFAPCIEFDRFGIPVPRPLLEIIA